LEEGVRQGPSPPASMAWPGTCGRGCQSSSSMAWPYAPSTTAHRRRPVRPRPVDCLPPHLHFGDVSEISSSIPNSCSIANQPKFLISPQKTGVRGLNRWTSRGSGRRESTREPSVEPAPSPARPHAPAQRPRWNGIPLVKLLSNRTSQERNRACRARRWRPAADTLQLTTTVADSPVAALQSNSHVGLRIRLVLLTCHQRDVVA
jgi:hypothetical protein